MSHLYKIEEIPNNENLRYVRKVSCEVCGRSVTSKHDTSIYGILGFSVDTLKVMLDSVDCEEAQAADVVES